MRHIPPEINTNCPELNQAWKLYMASASAVEGMLVPDTDQALNCHAFLGHSIDMQGFRAGEFAGVEKLRFPSPGFIPLNQRGISVRELGQLWETEPIQRHLVRVTARAGQGAAMESTYAILSQYGGHVGRSLTEAFQAFPRRKGHWCVRALLENSWNLKECGYSFRNWLKRKCRELGMSEFPPTDFRQPVSVGGGTESLEEALCRLLERTFYRVGPEMAPYMICDWQLLLWMAGKTGPFETFKLDQFHRDFVNFVNGKHGQTIIPLERPSFLRWWLGFCPDLPPRLANEVMWLAKEDSLLEFRAKKRPCVKSDPMLTN